MYVGGPRTLSLPVEAEFPLSVVAECRVGESIQSIQLSTVDFLDEPVLVFSRESGRLVDSFIASQSVLLVVCPGAELRAPAEFMRLTLDSGPRGASLYEATTPADVVTVPIEEDDEVRDWPFGAAREPLRVEVRGPKISDL